mmetsp:Transcript_74020/g.190981  ORF Transcript_74020/g.190981 Transcript_74020/m.190981 type:complete len:129 (-) Transcript_74020:68-454(-)
MDPKGRNAPPLPNERYKLCRIVCEKRNGWTLQSFCRSSYAGVCTKHWRLGHPSKRCVAPQAEWVEKLLPDSSCCIDATIKSRGKSMPPSSPEADGATLDFCAKQCTDALDREREWLGAEVWDLCKQNL